jgi:trans-aconitate methyltransferase
MVNWNASDYSKHSSAQQQWALDLAAQLELAGHERVLDIGSGDGKFTAYLASKVPDGYVLGIDASPSMADFAREAFPEETYPNLDFRLQDATEMSFDAEFDVVFSNAVLHWIKDHGPLIDRIRNALVPGGRFLASMGGRGNAASIFAILDELASTQTWGPFLEGFDLPWGFYGPQEYTSWLEVAGLVVNRLELVEKDMVQAGSDGLAGWIRTTWIPYVQRIPEEQQAEFISAIVDSYLESHPLDEDGNAHVVMVRLEVDANRSEE